MKQSKKLIITIAILAVMLFAMTMGLIVVLVLSNQRAKSNINVKYTASDVMVKISAKAYEGVTTHTFKNGTSTTLELSPTNMEGSLSQTEEEIILTKNSPRIVFEYKFENMTSDIDAVIANDGIPATQENIKLSYATSDSEVQILNAEFQNHLNFTDTYTTQLLPAYPNASQNVRYVYVMAEIESLVHDAEFSGDFVWGLSKPADGEVMTETVYDSDIEPVFQVKYLDGTQMFEPGFEQLENKMFKGFYNGLGDAVPRIEFPRDLNNQAGTTLYAHYLDGNVPASNIEYNEASDSYHVVGQLDSSFTSDTLVIPDLYNDGTHGVKPITEVNAYYNESDYKHYGLLYNNSVVKNLYFGNNIKRVDWTLALRVSYYSRVDDVASCVLEFAYLGRGFVAHSGVSFLERISTLSEVQYSHKYRFDYSSYKVSEDMWGDPSGIYYPKFYGTNVNIVKPYDNANRCVLVNTSNVTALSEIDGYEEVNEFASQGKWLFVNSKLTSVTLPSWVNTIGECMFQNSTSLTSVTLPSGVQVIEWNAFNGCSNLSSLTIPSSVVKIGPYAFDSCSKLGEWNSELQESHSKIVFEDADSVWTIGGETFLASDPFSVYFYIQSAGHSGDVKTKQ